MSIEHALLSFVRGVDPWNWASVAVATVVYTFLNRDIRKGEAEQNPLTFALWGLLDGINGIALLVSGGNFFLQLYYVGGCMSVLYALHVSGKSRIKMGWGEYLVSLLVGISLLGWSTSGPYWAAVWSTVGVMVAGILQIIDGWKVPEKQPIGLYFGFMLVNALATMAGHEWSVPERLYGASCVILCLVTALVPLAKLRYRRVNAFFEEMRAQTSID